MKTHTKNLLSVFGFDAAIRLLGFVSTAYIARAVGNEGFGMVNFGLTLYSYGMLVVSPGLHIIGSRMASQQIAQPSLLLKQITSLRVMLSFLTGPIIAVCALLFIRDEVLRTVVLLYAITLLPFALNIEWYFQGRENIASIGINRTLSTLFYTVGVVVMVHSLNDIYLIPVAFFIGTTINAILLHAANKRASATTTTLTAKASISWMMLLRSALPVGSAYIFAQVVMNAPILLLGVFSTTIEIGYFSAAMKIIFFLLTVDRAIYYLFFPLVSRTFASKPDALPHQINRIIRYVLVATLPLCVGGVIVSESLLTTVFGSTYASSSTMLQILFFYFFFTILNTIFVYLLIAIGKEKKSSSIMIAFSLLLLVALVPITYYWKGIGASAGLAVGEGVLMFMMYQETLKSFSLTFLKAGVRPFLAVCCMGGVVAAVSSYGLLVSISAGAATYLTCLFAFRAITHDDIIFLKERFV